MKSNKLIFIAILITYLIILFGFFALTSAWTGTWTFVETCNDNKIDVEATYTPTDELSGTVQYVTPHTGLNVGDEVIVNLVEDNSQTNTYSVHIGCEEVRPMPPTPEPTHHHSSGSKPKVTPTPEPIPQIVITPAPDLPRTGIGFGMIIILILIGLAGSFYLTRRNE